MALSDEMRNLTQHMLAGHESRTAAVAGIRTSTAEELAEFHAAHQAQAAEQREQLDEYMNGLRRDTAAFLSDATGARQAMATQQRERLDEYTDGLRRDTEALLKELDAAHEAMATEQRQRLATERERLTSDVAAMRDRFQAEQREMRADLSEAQRVWSSFSRQMQQRRAGRPAAAPPPPRSPAKETPPASTEEADADDLTVIRGIGPAMQHRLNKAGFYTYVQLAKAAPTELRQALGEVGARVNMEEWVEQARELELK